MRIFSYVLLSQVMKRYKQKMAAGAQTSEVKCLICLLMNIDFSGVIPTDKTNQQQFDESPSYDQAKPSCETAGELKAFI